MRSKPHENTAKKWLKTWHTGYFGDGKPSDLYSIFTFWWITPSRMRFPVTPGYPFIADRKAIYPLI